LLRACHSACHPSDSSHPCCHQDFCKEHEEEAGTEPGLIFLFPGSALAAGVIFKQGLTYLGLNIPETVMLFIWGVIMGYIANVDSTNSVWSESIKVWAEQARRMPSRQNHWGRPSLC
jgi:Na+/glutamate symporter